MPIANLEHINLYYESHGKGEPLILISDIGQDSQSWEYIINNLSRHFQVITFDNCCCGQSDYVNTKFTISDMAKDTVSLLDFLDIQETHILGHGMGGFVAQEIAINHPKRVFKLILEDTTPFSSLRNNMLLNNLLKLRAEKIDDELWLRELYFWLYSSKYLENTEFINALIEYHIKYPHKQTIEGFESQIRAFEKFDSRTKLKKIQAETLIIIGEDDILITTRDADKLYQGITIASYPVYIENSGHCIHQEKPKEFVHAILGFLYKYNR